MGCRRCASTMTPSNASKSDSLRKHMHPADGTVQDVIVKASQVLFSLFLARRHLQTERKTSVNTNRVPVSVPRPCFRP
jgi:hypothetical protein